MSNVSTGSDNIIQGASLKLSFIIKYLLPDVRGDIFALCHSREAQPDGSPGDLLQSGSVAEGLSLPNMMMRQDTGQSVPIAFNTDVDTMHCVEMKPGARLETWRQNGDLKPGFCRILKPTSSGGDGGLYYTSSRAKEKMLETFSTSLDPFFLLLDTSEDRAAALLESREVPLNLDVILAVCAEWPEEASEWRERSRQANWPSSELIQDIIKSGIHLVPKPHALSQDKDVEWRMSFSLAEIKLGRSLREEQRLCYLAVKALHHMELKEPEGLASYHLKTILFWTCEKTHSSLWTMDTLGRGFLTLLDELIGCLREGRISNYFTPECNLIELVKKEDLGVWLAKLEAIRKDPIPFLIRFHDLYRRMSSLSPPNNEDNAIKDRNRYATGIRLVAKQDSIDGEKSVFLQGLYHLGFCYAAEGKFLDMAHLAAHFKSLENELTMDEAPFEGHPARVKLLIRFMEALVYYYTNDDEQTPTHRMMVMVTTNLARLQHEASKVAESASERDLSLAKAYEGFSKILTSVHHDASSALLFANFLYDQRRLDEAIVVLKSSRTAPSWCSFIVFNEYTAHTPDDFLKEEFQARTEVEYWVPTFTLYLLFSCYVDNGQIGMARELLPELFDERERSSEAFSYADSCVLLGYCYLRLEEREEALSLFKEAVDEYSSDSGKYWYEKTLQEDDTQMPERH